MSTAQPQSSETIMPYDELPLGMLWTPVRGEETQALMTYLDLGADSEDRVLMEASNVLGKCTPPTGGHESTTGLVLGYVQSGKTMSFTTVAALARDNGYPMVIVVTGISNPLLTQSTTRLEEDLRLKNNRKWRLFRNPKLDDRQSMADVLGDWSDTRLSAHRRKTLLVTVLKNTTHLKNLNRVLERLQLENTPVLVIDDEADQAGLNTFASQGVGAQSTTYQRLVTLRQNLPRHAYLQYTATPQGPLLINIIDVLSPRFAELLTPGDDYVGGEGFFEQNPNLVRIIPANEIPTKSNPLTEVPTTLISALKLFFLGVAVGFITGDDQPTGRKPRNRSMLVHPSRETVGHGQFYHWISQIKQQWLDILRLELNDQERLSFVAAFQNAYDDLSATCDHLPTFEEVIAELEYSIRQTSILEVNAKPNTPQPDWEGTYSWILVGGQAMDRGFTVEGLTVTYMPRPIGVGNADTIEQRARFFGYKRKYLGLCRVFLEAGVRDAFAYYVEHEKDIRRRLQGHRDSGRPLSEWHRAFFLDRSLRPTRPGILDLDYRQDALANDWFWAKVPHGTDEMLASNRSVVSDFIDAHSWHDSSGDPRRTQEQIHLITENLRLQDVWESLLYPLRLTSERDSQIYTGLRLQLHDYLQKHPDTLCSVYRMSRGTQRVRSVNDDDEIPTLFQGANYAGSETVYPGDERERHQDRLTIQIHNLEIRQKGQGAIIASNVPAIAVWIPSSMSRDWLVQEQS